MYRILSNIQDSYRGFFTELQEIRELKQRVSSDECSEEDVLKATSLALKFLGTFSLAFLGLIALHSLYHRSVSISKFIFSGIFFITGHDLLKAGENVCRRFKKFPTDNRMMANGFQKSSAPFLGLWDLIEDHEKLICFVNNFEGFTRL